MPVKDDGDLIRGLGYVALYAAYLEEAIDEVLSAVATVEKNTDSSLLRWPISRKLKYIGQTMEAWGELPAELNHFKSRIGAIKSLFDERNLVIHGRIYADPKTGDILKPARSGYPKKPALSADLYALANRLFAEVSPCNHASIFAIPRYLERKAK